MLDPMLVALQQSHPERWDAPAAPDPKGADWLELVERIDSLQAVLDQIRKDVTKRVYRPTPVAVIKELLMDVYKISRRDIEARNRKGAKVRQIGFYLCKHFTSHSYPMLGRIWGGLDHTTVMYAVRIVDARMKKDPKFHAEIESLKQQLAVHPTIRAAQ